MLRFKNIAPLAILLFVLFAVAPVPANFTHFEGPVVGAYFTVTLSAATAASPEQYEWVSAVDCQILQISSGLASGTIATAEITNVTDSDTVATLTTLTATPEQTTTITDPYVDRGDTVRACPNGASSAAEWNLVLFCFSDRDGLYDGETVNGDGN